jgi:hypothetical protein
MPHTADQLLPAPVRTSWSGVWIWPDAVEKDRNVYALFRRAFTLDAPGMLEIAITADSHYLLYVDGAVVCRGPMRAPLDYYAYDTHVLALEAGPHAIAVLVHHIGEINATVMTGRPGLLADATVRGEGWETDLSTGPGWLCTLATAWRKDLPEMMSHFGFWEECDLRALPDWTVIDFPAAGWHAPAVIGTPPCAPWARLVARDIALPVYTPVDAVPAAGGTWVAGTTDAPHPSKQAAARVRTPGDARLDLPAGGYLSVDCGRTVSGYPEIVLADSTPGAILDISYDEWLQPDGAVNPERSYAHLTDRYLLPGGPCTVRPVQPRGFRYLTLDIDAPCVIVRAGAVEETYPFVQQEACITDDTRLNAYLVKAAETVRVNTTDAFTDCPTRERVQWTEDLYMHCQVALHTFGDTRMLRHSLFQAAQCALPDGRINGFFPSERTNCAFAAGTMLWLHLLTDYWLHTGRTEVENLLPTAQGILALCDSLLDDDGLLARWPAGQFWDWAPIEGSDCLLLTNAVYAWALARMAEQPVFAPLGDLAARADRMRASAHARFWDADRGFYRDAVNDLPPLYSQQANTLAVLAGICPAEERVPLLRRLIDPANLGPVPVGEHSLRPENRPASDKLVPFGTLWFAHFLVRALFEHGLDAEALAQMHALWGAYDDLPTYPETRLQKGNTGHCHGWAGGPAFLLPAYVLGVQPTAPRVVRVAPHPGPLTDARGTCCGVTVHWQRTGDRLTVHVDAPKGTEIEVVGPEYLDTVVE